MDIDHCKLAQDAEAAETARARMLYLEDYIRRLKYDYDQSEWQHQARQKNTLALIQERQQELTALKQEVTK